jgi:hypothetical protein
MYEVMSEPELDPGIIKPEDFEIQGEDLVKKRRALKYTDDAGKSQFVGTPDRNKATARPRKAKS